MDNGESEFEPQIVKKRQTMFGELEDKIVAMYSKGMTTRDIQDVLKSRGVRDVLIFSVDGLPFLGVSVDEILQTTNYLPKSHCLPIEHKIK